MFFQGTKTEIQKVVYSHSAKEDDNHSSASGSTHDDDHVDDVVEVGPEISSSMASATKIFREKSLREDKLKSKIESGKLPANWGFTKTKQCTTEVWVTLGEWVRSQYCKLQEVQKLLAAPASQIVQASSELTKQLVSSKQPRTDSLDAKVPLTLLQNALSLAGKLNRSINQLRRNFITPLPAQYARLADIADDSSEHFFRDSITDSLESLKKENQIKALLKKGNTPFHNILQTSMPLPRP